ncbi:MAG: hypothetical protein WCK26_02610 [Candidatus Saccharibacteria bacterium]
MKKIHIKQSGFSAVELLITLFIAAAFLISGFQLYAVVIKDGGEARMQSRAGNLTDQYISEYSPLATNPCTTSPVGLPAPNETVTVEGLSNVKRTITFSCPYATNISISKISVTVTYGSPLQTVNNSTYVKP